MAERVFDLCGAYADIYEKLMSYDPDWVPTQIGEDEDDEDEEYDYLEFSLEGPAGTGKTFFEGVLLEDLHSRYPRLRSAVVRKTRASLSNSWMQVFEDDVLGEDHPMLQNGPGRDNRRKYVWNNNGRKSETNLAGMDNPSRLFSTQYDVVIIVEAIEFTEDEYMSIYRAMRNKGAEFKAIICDTNPGNVNHWLNKKPDREGSTLERVLTKHRDNPYYFDPIRNKWTKHGKQYQRILDQYTGVLRKRMKDGVWCSAEGAIWDNFDPDYHIIDRGKITLDKPYGENLPDFEYFVGSLDLGWHDATSLGIWGVTADRRMYLIYERYGRHVEGDTLASWLVEAHKKFDFVRCVSDHRPEVIHMLNERLGWRGLNHSGNLVMKAQKGSGSLYPGLLLVRDLLGDKESGKASKMFFVRDALVEPDLYLKGKGLPTCTVEEIPGYVWAEQKEDKPAKNEPDPGCIDHGCDMTRYGAIEVWKSDFRSEQAKKVMRSDNHWNSKAVREMSEEDKEAWLAENDL